MAVERPEEKESSLEEELRGLEERYQEAKGALFGKLSEFFSGKTRNPPPEEDFRKMQQVLEELRLYSERKRKEEKP